VSGGTITPLKSIGARFRGPRYPAPKEIKMTYHLLYRTKNGHFRNVIRSFASIQKAENWLYSIQAQQWEIGVKEK